MGQLGSRCLILDAIVNHKFHYEDTKARLRSFVIITQVVHYWSECLARDGGNQEAARRMIDVAGNEHFLDEFYRDKIFADVFDTLCDYVATGTSPWRSWRHVEQLVGVLQERWLE